MSNDTRRPGQALSPVVVRALRERAGLTQEQLAERLGMAGKAVVSGWETGRTNCEGPAAELVLHLFGGGGATEGFIAINEAVERTWRRAGTWSDTWRQISAVPEVPVAIERNAFAKLFPGAEIPPDGHVHGFPFINHGLPDNVYGIGPDGWTGVIPIEEEAAPHYLWALTRTGGFVYREVPWERNLNGSTGGHTHVGSLLEIAASTTFFLRRLAERAKLEPSTAYVLSLDLEGMRNRGIVGATNAWMATDQPRVTSKGPRVRAEVKVPLADIVKAPVDAAYSVVGELLLELRPDLATTAKMKAQLEKRLEADRGTSLGFVRFLERQL